MASDHPAPSRLRRLAAGVVLVAVACAAGRGTGRAALAQPARPASPPPEPTALLEGPLGRAALVLVAHPTSVRDVRGLLFVEAAIESVVRGRPPGPTVNFLVRGTRPTDDPERPSAPYLRPGDRRRYVLFLEGGRGGHAYELLTLFLAEGAVGEAKLRAVVAQASLLEVEPGEPRARAALALLLGALEEGDTWTRVHAARELNHLARTWPGVFDAATRQRLAAWRARTRAPTLRRWLDRLLRCFADETGPPTSPPAAPDSPGADAPAGEGLAQTLEEAGDDERRIARLEAHLARGDEVAWARALDVLAAQPTAVRRWLVRAAAASGRAELAPRLRAHYSGEDDPEVLEQIVAALGFLGGDADVPWLEARWGSLRLRRAVLFALARIRTEAAMAALDRLRARAGQEESGDLAALVDYLASDAFVQAERQVGRDPGGMR